MRNLQTPERMADNSDGLSLDVHSKWNTIQGEGPFAGSPASFIRLAGCNLQCPLCDTDYTSTRSKESVVSIIDWVKAQPHELVVLTGGEPFRQNLRPFACAMRDIYKGLQIETNGTFIPDDFPGKLATIVCSPKGSHLSRRTADLVHSWKYVLRHDAVDSADGLPTSALGMNSKPARPTNGNCVYVQPCDDKDPAINKLNMDAAVSSCMKFGYRLCLQIQKIIQMP